MHPLIADLTRDIVYGGQVRDDDDMLQERNVPWSRHWAYGPVSVIDIGSRRDSERGQGTSFRNDSEANAIVHVLEEFSRVLNGIQPDEPVTVAVIAMYKSQVPVLQEKLEKVNFSRFLQLAEVQTTDSFRGQAADHVFVSPVRTFVSAFLEEPERLNVTFTRARQGLHIVGCVDAIRKAKSPLWRNLIKTAESLKRLGPLSNVKGSLFGGQTWSETLWIRGYNWTASRQWDKSGRTFVGENGFVDRVS